MCSEVFRRAVFLNQEAVSCTWKLENMPFRSESSLQALIIEHVKYGNLKQAFDIYEKLQGEETAILSAHAYVALLRACSRLKDLKQGIKLHEKIATTGLLQRDLHVGSAMVHMYAKCGSLIRAQQVFDHLSIRNIVSWNVLIRGYAEAGRAKEALKHFESMKLQNIFPDSVTFLSILKSCGITRDLQKGEETHSEISRRGLLERNHILQSALVDMYAKGAWMDKAQEVFDRYPVHDVVAWTTLIGAYAENGYGDKALKLFEEMISKNVLPDAATFVCCIKACSSIHAIDKGLKIHAEVARNGLLERNAIIGSALVDMYVKFGFVVRAQEVFNKLLVRNVVCWTTLITGYVEYDHDEEALNLYKKMKFEGISPNGVTYVSSLRACASSHDIEQGHVILADIERNGLLETDITVGNALIDMYAKIGALNKAQEIFDRLPVQNVVSWNSLISGYAEQRHGDAALKCFKEMQLKGITPDAVTFVSVLKACGSIGALSKGVDVHAEVSRKGLLEDDLILANSLLDMYCKCGALDIAQRVFDKLPNHDMFSCNSLIAGYAQLGKSQNVFHMFDRMFGEGIRPGWITFIIVLNTCSRTGLFSKCQMYFEAMSKNHGVSPTQKHDACVVNILCRIGELDEAAAMSERLPSHSNPKVWYSMLNACKNWGNIGFAHRAFKNAVIL